MLDHIGFPVADFARSREFYARALAPLGITIVMELSEGRNRAGFGTGRKPFFWINSGGPLCGEGLHVCFSAPDRASVDAFYAAAMAAGGRDNGPPGLRLHYHPSYYAAFVLDPDGHNIEAVCHAPQ